MIKWWHQNNWGKAACGRRTRALKCRRSCACKHSKFLVLEICLVVCNLSSNNFCALWQKRLFWSASIYCCSFLAEIEQLCYVNIQFEHSVQTRNSSIPTSSVNIQLKHSIQTNYIFSFQKLQILSSSHKFRISISFRFVSFRKPQ